MGKKSEELLAAVDESKRDLLKRVLTGGAAVYVAPIIASFCLSASFSGSVVHAGNQPEPEPGRFRCHPLPPRAGELGARGVSVPPSPGHQRHGDVPTDVRPGGRCFPDGGK